MFGIAKNYRYESAENAIKIWESPYSSYKLTNQGEMKIAEHYNEKYFKNDPLGRKIIAPNGHQDFEDKLIKLINTNSCEMAGLLFKCNDHPDAHPTPVIFERKGEAIHLFISDSVSHGEFAYKK